MVLAKMVAELNRVPLRLIKYSLFELKEERICWIGYNELDGEINYCFLSGG